MSKDPGYSNSKADRQGSQLRNLEDKLEIAKKVLEKIAFDDEDNSNFSTSAEEAQYYMDLAKNALSKLE